MTTRTTSLFAGDTLEHEFDSSDYSAEDGWSGTLYLAGPTPVNQASVADGSALTFTVSATQTSVMTPGQYTATVRVTDGSSTKTCETWHLTVLANPAIATSTTNIAQQMIALIDKALIGALTDGEAVQSITLAGRSVAFMNRKELLEERAFWMSQIRRQRTGTVGSIRIHVR